MKKWEESEFYIENRNRPSEDGSFEEVRKRCLRLLEFKPRTVYQLQKRLSDDGYDKAQIEDAISYAKKFGYVDDSNYAMEYVRTRCNKDSQRQLYLKLSTQGVDTQLIEKALEEYADEQEKTVYHLAEKKIRQKSPTTEEELIKVIRYLVTKGFPYELSKRAAWECWEKNNI